MRVSRWLLSVPLIVGAFVACLPHPEGDYEEFVDKTANLRGLERDGGGIAVEASVPVEKTSGAYFAVCLPGLVSGRVDRALRFYAETEFTPTEGGAGTLKLTLSPFSTAARVFAKSSVAGAALDVGDAIPVSSSADFSGSLANADIVGGANPISGSDINIVDITLAGKFSAKGNFCSDFKGRVTKPIQNTFEAECIYLDIAEGTAFEILPPGQGQPDSFLVVGDAKYGKGDFGCQ